MLYEVITGRQGGRSGAAAAKGETRRHGRARSDPQRDRQIETELAQLLDDIVQRLIDEGFLSYNFV